MLNVLKYQKKGHVIGVVKSRKAINDRFREEVRIQMLQSLYNLYAMKDGKPLEDFE